MNRIVHRSADHQAWGFPMSHPFRFVAIISAVLAICGPAMAEQAASADSGVKIEKQVINNGLAQSIKYFVTGGSPQLQALVRRVEWAENELSIVNQLQLLKLDTVVDERRVAAVRTALLTNPFVPPGFIAPYVGTGYGGYGGSSLQSALTGQLAYEATPQVALQLIGYLEQQQTQLEAELKALPPQEQKAAQGPIDALRPRLAALTGGNVPPSQAQPAVPSPQPQVTPVTAPAAMRGAIEVQWGSSWYPAEVLQVNGGLTRIHYTGWSSSSDEWVPPGRIRSAAAATAPPQIQAPLKPLELPQFVNQQFLLVQHALTQGH